MDQRRGRAAGRLAVARFWIVAGQSGEGVLFVGPSSPRGDNACGFVGRRPGAARGAARAAYEDTLTLLPTGICRTAQVERRHRGPRSFGPFARERAERGSGCPRKLAAPPDARPPGTAPRQRPTCRGRRRRSRANCGGTARVRYQPREARCVLGGASADKPVD